MGADFYTEDYLSGGGGGYYDSGGGSTDIGAGSDFNYGYGFDTGLPPDYAPGVDQGGQYYYDPSTGGVLDTGLQQGGGSDLFGAFFDYYSAQGYDDYTAMQMASQDAAAGSIYTPTYEQGPLPDLPQYYGLPYVPDYDYWQSPPYIPSFPEGPVPAPPLPPSPATQQTGLPPYCPAGQYHPYPIGHPQQNVCVPFPTAQTPGTQPRPSGQPSGGAPSAPRPPQQQQQRPPQQQRCTTPGTVFDQATGRCVPRGQAVSPLPSEAGDLLSNLKSIPWWVWLALGGMFLLSRDSDGGRKTTVTYRRAS